MTNNTTTPIVVIGFPAWEGNYVKSTIKITEQLATTNPVLYVQYPFTITDLFKGFMGNPNIPMAQMLRFQNPLKQVAPNLHVLTLPPMLPINRISQPKVYNWLLNQAAAPLIGAIKSAIKKLNFDNPVVVNAFNPYLGLPALFKIKSRATYYYTYDNIAAAKWCQHHGPRLEAEYAQKVNGVITSSVVLKQKLEAYNPNVKLIQNGVDYKHFAKARNYNTKTQQPVAGYIGTLDARLDYNLITWLSQQLPQVIFRFVGRQIGTEANAIKHLPNIEILNPVAPDALPKVLSGFNVGLIPFAQNEFNKSVYPLKINEYLAAGLPVVSTNFAPLPEFESTVLFAKNRLQFDARLRSALLPVTDDQIKKRQKVAYLSSWEKRAHAFRNFILNNNNATNYASAV